MTASTGLIKCIPKSDIMKNYHGDSFVYFDEAKAHELEALGEVAFADKEESIQVIEKPMQTNIDYLRRKTFAPGK